MTAFWLRLIACVTMLIDHYGLLYHPTEIGYRIVGRLAFPIFAFLIANGYRYTRDWRRYLFRLLGFAIVSEIPYDRFLYGVADQNFQHQNIFFTLALGLLLLVFDEYLQHKVARGGTARASVKNGSWNPVISVFTTGLFCVVAELTNVSYGYVGILSVYFMYLWIHKRISVIITAIILFFIYDPSSIQAYAVIALVPLALYNGQPGPKMKLIQYSFYLFYPLHIIGLHYLPLR